jgi:tetratricopeptide (TPR) repeat protein
VPDVATIVTGVVSAIGGLLGGGGAGGYIQSRRQSKRERTQDIWDSFREQAASAEARGDGREADRLRRDYEAQQEAWRAQQGVRALAPKDLTREKDSRLSEGELTNLVALLAKADVLVPALLSVDDLFLRGNAFHAAGLYEEAAAAFTAVLRFNREGFRALHNRGLALVRLGRIESALQDYEAALALHPGHPTLLLAKANALTELRQFEEAEKIFNELVDADPTNADFRNSRAFMLMRKGNVEKARSDCDIALATHPSYPFARYNRACIRAWQGDANGALSDLKLAILGHAEHRALARTDPWFEPIRSHPRFLELVGGDQPPERAEKPS